MPLYGKKVWFSGNDVTKGTFAVNMLFQQKMLMTANGG
jgi:hypothetical protein